MPDSAKKTKEALKKAPTLYVIIILKLLKGFLFVGLALMVYTLSDNDLPAEFQHWLQVFKANPERKFWSDLATGVGHLTEAKMVHFAVGALIYSLFALVEGVGLMFRASWAGWLSIGESAFFIPIEVYELVRRFTWPVFVIMVLNVFMVWYLFQNRERLFRRYRRE
jgi:uncharacterized membrane protein (DUF2068 family)